jgi:outer membrane protein assembly factor BamB
MRFKLIHSVFTLLIISASIVLPSCTGIKVEQDVKISPGDWVMAGGSPEQQHNSAYTLTPPLALMWDYNTEGGVGPSGICIADAVLFVNGLQGEMFTFDVATGGKIGNIKFLGKDASTAPLIMGNDVIVSYAGDNKYSLASYNISAGQINWRKNFGYVQTSPILKDGHVYFGSLGGTQYKAESSTGKRIWKHETKSPIHSTCAVTDESVIFGNDAGNIYCLNTTDGSEKWKIETKIPVTSTPMTNEGIAYIGGGDSNFYAINISSGSVLWKNNLKTKLIGGSALFQNEQIVLGCVDGSIYSLNIADGTIKWKYSTRGTVISTPVISGSFIYVTSYDSYVYCLDGYTGNMLWSWQLENKSKTTPIVWKDYLFVAADDIVYCFTNKPTIEKKK